MESAILEINHLCAVIGEREEAAAETGKDGDAMTEI
jgi:hypothetical protein